MKSSNKSFKSEVPYKLFPCKSYIQKQDMTLNNTQDLICHKTPTNKLTNRPSKIIFIIIVCWQYGFFWISQDIDSFQPSHSLLSPDGIQCPDNAHRWKISLIGQYWCIHVKETIRELCLCVCPYFLVFSACLAHLTWIICLMGSIWPYNHCFEGCFFQDLLKKACHILVYFSSSFFSRAFIKVQALRVIIQTFLLLTRLQMLHLLQNASLGKIHPPTMILLQLWQTVLEVFYRAMRISMDWWMGKESGFE